MRSSVVAKCLQIPGVLFAPISLKFFSILFPSISLKFFSMYFLAHFSKIFLF